MPTSRFNAKKPNIFRSEHFKIEIKLPNWKHLDMDDADDINIAKAKLAKELKILIQDDVLPALGVYVIEPPVQVSPKALPKNDTEMKPLHHPILDNEN
jgi:hypothetical protein